jgi:hypothetical protein
MRMNADLRAEPPRDILSSPWLAGAVFCLPFAVIVLSGNLNLANPWRGLVWSVSLGVMAAGCLFNAIRCGRMHCYFTGPFFILMALASLSYGFGALSLGAAGWNWIGGVALGGGVLLTCVPEIFLGKYRRR